MKNTTLNIEAKKRLDQVKSGIITDPRTVFFAALLFNMPLVENTEVKTMRTDGDTIEYSPDYVMKLSLAELKGVLCHEVLHPALLHHTRMEGRQPKKWNRAADYAINPILTEAGLTLPAGALNSAAFKSLSTEAVYNQLPDDPDNGGGSGNGSGNDPGGTGEVAAPKNNKQGKGGKGGKQQCPQQVKQAQENKWKVATAQAAAAAKSQGKLGAAAARAVKELLYPSVDWKAVLRDFLEGAARNDFSFLRPNLRFAGSGLIMPTLHSMDELQRVFVAIDTSGSVCQKELDHFAAEISSILEEFNTEITVMYCDTHHYEESNQTFTSDDLPLDLKAKGGGGTDFRPPFQWLEKQGIIPACLIYFTDLACSRYPAEPNFPVLWAATYENSSLPPFGEVIQVKTN